MSDVAFKKVTAKGKRYVYLRGTNVALIRGFSGTDADLEKLLAGPDVASIISGHRSRAVAMIDGWRTDAGQSLHKVTKARAVRRGQAYSLSPVGIANMLAVANDRCEVTGIQFDYGRKKAETGWLRRPLAPSLDRISNRRGYEPDNLRAVCVCVNVAINEWGLENFEKICRAFVSMADLAAMIEARNKAQGE